MDSMSEIRKDLKEDKGIQLSLVILGIILVLLIVSIITTVENRVQLNKLNNLIIEQQEIQQSQKEFEERLSLMDPVFIYDALVFYWSFDYPSNESDSNSIKFSNGSAFSSDGKFSGAVNVSGGNSYVDLGYYPNQISTDNVTISYWVKFNEINPSEDILTNNLYRFYHKIYSENDEIYFLVRVTPLENTTSFTACDSSWNGWVGVKSQLTLEEDRWYNVVGVKSGNKLAIYIDGLKQKELDNCFQNISSVASDDIRHLFIGRSELNGMIDELKIWNRDLTSLEIKYLAMQE